MIQSKLPHLKPVFNESAYLKEQGINSLQGGAIPSISSSNEVDIVCNKDSTPKLRRHKGKITGPLGDYLGRDIEQFLRALMCSHRLLRSMQIAQKYFAEQLGIEQYKVHRYIKTLIKDKNLVCSDSSYQRRGYAKRYRAAGALKDYLEAKSRYPTKGKLPIPKRIADGEWNEKLYAVAKNHFEDDHKGFWQWATRQPGANEKDRLNKIKNLCMKIKNRRI